ncbi:MAG: hypothetical protein AAF197_07910, partial [Pseudomonadota bacterium]
MSEEVIKIAEFDVRVLRTKRRTVCLELKDGIVTLRSPIRASQRSLREFAQTKVNWLRKHQSHIYSPSEIVK